MLSICSHTYRVQLYIIEPVGWRNSTCPKNIVPRFIAVLDTSYEGLQLSRAS